MSDVFKRAIDQVSRPVSSKQDFIQHFRQEYGEKNWKRQAATHMSGTSDAKSRAYKSAMRNFQGKRLNEAGATAKWKELGSGLPRIMTRPDFTLIVKGKQKGNDGRPPRDRVIKVDFAGEKAHEFVDNPTWGKVWDTFGFVFPVAGSDAEDWGEGEEDFDYGIYDYDVDADYSLSDVSVSAS